MQPLATHLAEQIGPDDSLYRQIAVRVAELIEHGTLRAGERVPSVRKHSARENVSIATVTQAYRLLESQGWIEARPQSGYYVRARPFQAPPEPALTRPPLKSTRVDISNLVMEVMHAVRMPELIGLGAACPSPEHMPGRELSRIMASVARRLPDFGNSYPALPGPLPFRKQVARRALEAGCALAPDDIVTTCGAMEALNLSLRAVAQPGDTIAIESPAYFGFLQIIESLGMKACEVPTYPRHGVCLDELRDRLKCCDITACLFSLNFSNPLGSCMPDEKKKALVELLAERDIPLIEDDLYGDLSFAPQRPKMAKAFDKKGLVLTCSSFSKTIAPGYRAGWVAPGRYFAKVEHLKFVNSSASALLPQLAVAEFLALGGYDNHLRRVRRIYAHNIHVMTEAITRHFPEGTKVTRPTGGHVLWVELPPKVNSLDLLDRALAAKISVAPGPMFSATRKFTNFIRLNAGNPWNERIERAITKLGQLVAEQAG